MYLNNMFHIYFMDILTRTNESIESVPKEVICIHLPITAIYKNKKFIKSAMGKRTSNWLKIHTHPYTLRAIHTDTDSCCVSVTHTESFRSHPCFNIHSNFLSVADTSRADTHTHIHICKCYVCLCACVSELCLQLYLYL